MGARGLPGRFVPRTRGARDNRGPFPGFSRVIPRLPFYLCLWDTVACGKVTKNLGLPCCASASNVPSVSHCCWTWASSLRRASLRVLDLGGAGGVAMVSRALLCLLYKGEVCSLTARLAFGSSAAMACKVSGCRCSSTCRTAIYALKQTMQPTCFASLASRRGGTPKSSSGFR